MNADFNLLLHENFEQNTFIKLTLSDKRDKSQELQKVLIKPVELKKGLHLSFIYRYPTKDITKNHLPKQAFAEITDLLDGSFQQALLFTSTQEIHLTSVGKVKKSAAKQTQTKAPDLSHDKTKKRLISPENNPYLLALGVTTKDGKVKKDMQDKFRQINKYIEIVDGALRDLKTKNELSIVDMGAGKGYLTYALYDYLQNQLNITTKMTGVELRPGLVDDGNKLAKTIDYQGMHFVAGMIENVELPTTDVLIALHACNTATDDAIYRGITSNAQLIICSPCCHKQIRQEMSKNNPASAITKHGILKERQAEIITDAIRALYLEAYGYKTQVFEFIATEHTPKNVIITAFKTKNLAEADTSKLEEVKQLKALFGIEKHYLETLQW